MAGIGFHLQALAERGDVPSAARAYGYSAVLVAGPWIFTVLALVGMTYALRPDTAWEEVQTFRSVLIYNFCATLILTGPVVLLATRYLADQIYQRNLSHTGFVFTVSLTAVASLTLLLAAPFYLLVVALPLPMGLTAIANFGLVACLWITIPYLSMLRHYRRIAFAFGLGAVLAVGLTAMVSWRIDDLQMLLIFNLSLCSILLLVVSSIFREYPATLTYDPGWRGFLRHRWELAPIGLLYYLGIWIDKIVMWHGGETGIVTVGGVLSTLPDYDSAMFKCQLLTIPAFVYFFIHVETRFFSHFQSLYRSFEAHRTLATIETRTQAIGQFAFEQLACLLTALLAVALLIILVVSVAPFVAGIAVVQSGTFRIGLVGTAFHTTFLFCLVFLLYFDLRRAVLALTALFCTANLTLTVLLLSFGEGLYGLGYLLASSVSLLAALYLLRRELPWLPYHAFITNNDSIRATRQ